MSDALLEFTLIDDGGTEFPLLPEARHALEVSGLGMPPIHHWTTRSPFQDGVTHWGYAIGPRTVDLILASQGCGRGGMYAYRRANVEMLSPRNSPLRLRLNVPGEALTYELREGWYQSNYELRSTDQSTGDGSVWNQVGAARLQFMDPLWKWVNSPLDVGETRDADGRTCIVDDTWTLAPALVLGFTGPFLLGTTAATNTLTCTNDGSWAVRPVLTVEGPIEDWVISNATSGHILIWDGYTIAAGETVTVDIPGKTATSDLTTPATDVSTYLSGDTGSFALEPGANTLDVFASGGVVHLTTTIGVCWFVELLGT